MSGLTAAESLLYTTVKLTTLKGGVETGSGTAFFYNVVTGEDRASNLLVTNKHVIDGCDQVVALCHVATPGDNPEPSGEFIRVVIHIDQTLIVHHPDPRVDLVAILISPLLNAAIDAGKAIFFVAVEASVIPTEKDWANFDAIEEVIMIGCPRGIFDEANNLPIVRRGTTATTLTKRYNGKDEFLIDMACFPGSSGSPVFIHNRDGFLDREQNTFLMGSTRLFFLGVLFSGPVITNTGEVILHQPPRFEVATMMHLGYVVRSTAMKVIDDLVLQKVAEVTKATEVGK